MHYTLSSHRIFSALILFLSPALFAESTENTKVDARSYMTQRQISLSQAQVEESSSDKRLTYTALVGDGVSIVFSEIAGYTFSNTAGSASALITRNFTDARMEFWIHPSPLTREDLETSHVSQHLAFVEKRLPPNSEFEILLQPDPSDRIFDRYFLDKPFELAYEATVTGKDGKQSRIVTHENWVVRAGRFMSVKLICPEENYPALLKEARRIWKSARLVSN